MVVFGQPKASAEYIQATSRVGRDVERPGLVVTIFNVHKPRDRSHFERFSYYHQTFYRSVEATSVTPFSPRALDKGLAATLVGLARQGNKPMTPALGAMEILKERQKLESVVQALAVICQEKDSNGKPIGKITVTYQGPITDDGTCATNPLCNGTWHEGYLYTLNGGTITVGTATAYQGQAPFKDEFGFALVIGFSVGAITRGTGKYQDTRGTLTMRWDSNVCICLFDLES